MITKDYIQRLSSDLKSSSKISFYKSTFFWWLFGTSTLLILSYAIFPARANLVIKAQSWFFILETILGLMLFMMASLVAYRSSVPSLLNDWEIPVGWIVLGLLVVSLLSRYTPKGFWMEFSGELDFYRGRCGPLILIIGILESTLSFLLARRAAPTRPALTGAWIALSAGSLGLFVMQLVCAHENFLHLVIWHATPLAFLVGSGWALGRRLLSW